MNHSQLTTLRLIALILIGFLGIENAPAQNISWDDGGIDKRWSTLFNWSPNGTPTSTSNVFIGDLASAQSDMTVISDEFTINNLTLSNFAGVDTNTLRLNAADIVMGLGTDIIVREHQNDDRSIQMTGLDIGNMAAFQMRGGKAAIGGEVMTSLGGHFTGWGEFRFLNGLGSPTTVFTNNGNISTGRDAAAASNERFTLNLIANDLDARIDLDGTTEDRSVNIAEQTTLNVDIKAEDFAGTMNMNAGSIFDMRDTWQTQNGSQFNVIASSASAGVADEATVRGGHWFALPGSVINVNSGSLVVENDFDAVAGSFLTVEDNSGLQLDGTAVLNGNLNLRQSSQLTINGSTTINDPSFNLDGANANNGTVTVNSGAELTINSDQININNNDFTGKMTINSGEVQMNTDGAWTLIGQLEMNADAGSSRLNGEQLRVVGGSIVADGNISIIHSDVELFGGATSTEVRAGATLVFDNETIFYGGSTHTGTGELVLSGNGFSDKSIVFNGVTTFDMPNGKVTLDSQSASTRKHQINADVTINAASVGTFGVLAPGNQTDRMNINNSTSTLTINLTDPSDEWTIGEEGELNINGTGQLNTSLAGSDVNVEGTINLNTLTRFTARLDIDATGTVDLGSNTFYMQGGSESDPNRMNGGRFLGSNGILRAQNTGLKGHGSISPSIQFIGNSDLFADDGTLFVLRDVLDVDLIGAEAGAELNLLRQLDTSIATALEVRGGTIDGSTINNNGFTRGNGLIETSGFVNNGQLVATGGRELIINTGSAPDLDGNSNSSVVHASSADIIVAGAIADSLGGSLAVESGQFIEFQQTWSQDVSGEIFLEGSNSTPAIIRGANATLNGITNVSGKGRFEAPTTFRASGTYNLPTSNSQLQLAANATIQPGSTFTGNGQLVNLNGSHQMRLNQGVDIGVHVRNEGDIVFIGAPGVLAEVQSFEQEASGELTFRLTGSGVGAYDRLLVHQSIDLAGTLDVDLLSGFSPQLDDEFLVVQSTLGFVNGTFDTLDLPGLANDLAWQVDYSDPYQVWLRIVADMISGDFDGNGDYACNDVDLLVNEIAAGTNGAAYDLTGDGSVNAADLDAWLAEAGAAELASGNPYLPGDADLDGNVNGSDFLIWNSNKFTSGNGWCGGDFDADGFTNGADFLIWNSHKFTSADSAIAAVPEPSSIVSLMLILLVTVPLGRPSVEVGWRKASLEAGSIASVALCGDGRWFRDSPVAQSKIS